MTDIKKINMSWQRKRPERLIYLGSRPRPYGVNEGDTYNLDSHLAAVMANSLRMLIAYGHTEIDEEEYEHIARKLELYATDTDSVIQKYLDWDGDKESVVGEEGWLSTSGRPAFVEYCAKSVQVDYWKRVYMLEALDWLKDHWGELWD